MRKLEILFPGNNSIGSVSVEKLDTEDLTLGTYEGVVGCEIDAKEGALPGIYLSDLEFSSEVMAVLLRPPKDITINLFTEYIEDDDKYSISFRVNPKDGGVSDINFTLSFSISSLSYRRFLEMVEDKNRVVLVIKTKAFFLFLKADPTSSAVIVKEVELMH